MQLKAGYEAFVGGAQGDAQVCFGDSGGPLVANVNGELVIQGVASGLGLGGVKLPCNMGAVYAVPGPAAQQLIKDALTDPCDGIPALGRCEGDVAVRCTNPDEGPRRAVRTDCSGLLQHCVGGGDADAGDAGAVVSCAD
jgi:S1-C subfamily serine protease